MSTKYKYFFSFRCSLFSTFIHPTVSAQTTYFFSVFCVFIMCWIVMHIANNTVRNCLFIMWTATSPSEHIPCRKWLPNGVHFFLAFFFFLSFIAAVFLPFMHTYFPGLTIISHMFDGTQWRRFSAQNLLITILFFSLSSEYLFFLPLFYSLFSLRFVRLRFCFCVMLSMAATSDDSTMVWRSECDKIVCYLDENKKTFLFFYKYLFGIIDEREK